MIFSTVGQIAIKGSSAEQRRVHAEVYIAAAGQLKARLTLKVPYTQKYYQVGTEKNVAFELPLRIVAQKSRSDDAIQFAITPTHMDSQGTPSGQIRILSVDTVPYTAVIKDPWARKMSDKYETYDVIRTGKPTRDSAKIGREELGLKFIYETEEDKHVSSSRHWDYLLYKNMNITADLSASETNTILVTLGQGRASQLSPSSGSSSSSSSDESSDSTQGNSVEIGTNIKRGLVYAVAVTGKKAVIQPVDNKATSIQDIDNKNAKNTFQYLAQFVVSNEMDQGFFRVARGAAADKAATTMPQSGGLHVVREAITQSDTNSQQGQGCVQINHKYDAARSTVQGKSTLIVKLTIIIN